MSNVKERDLSRVKIFDPRMGQWLARLPREVSYPAIWSPYRGMAVPLSKCIVEDLSKDWPYLNSCTLVEAV